MRLLVLQILLAIHIHSFSLQKEKKLFEQDVAGSFGGVGMQIGMKDGVPTVISPLKNSPAERAGIMSGDKIVEIDGASVKDFSIDTVLLRFVVKSEQKYK